MLVVQFMDVGTSSFILVYVEISSKIYEQEIYIDRKKSLEYIYIICLH